MQKKSLWMLALLPLCSTLGALELTPTLELGLGKPSNAATVAICKVLDSELQGDYQGPCKDGLAEGLGSARSDKATYTGYFLQGKKHGQGHKYWLQTGDSYQGYFAHDYRHGYGTYTWGPQSALAGHEYTGQFVQDKREGTGSFTWPTGDTYSGTWHKDLQTGPATPMQTLQQRHIKANRAALSKVGNTLCQYSRPFNGTLLQKAQVLSAQDLSMRLQIIWPEDKKRIEPAASYLQWQPCHHSDAGDETAS